MEFGIKLFLLAISLISLKQSTTSSVKEKSENKRSRNVMFAIKNITQKETPMRLPYLSTRMYYWIRLGVLSNNYWIKGVLG